MKRPTLKDVKKHFKDAKEIECLMNGFVFDISKSKIKKNVSIGDYDSFLDTPDDCTENLLIFNTDLGYAKILTYKEKDMKISKEFIKANADKTLKEVFPEVCGLPKDFTGWVKSIKEIDVDWLMYFEKGVQKYGFDSNKEWWESTTRIEEVLCGDEVESTESEIFEALKNEAVKRGFVGKITHTCTNSNSIRNKTDVNDYFGYDEFSDKLLLNNYSIYNKGQWSEVKNKLMFVMEAEEKLNCKII